MNDIFLTKRVPAKTRTVYARWCKKNFMQMSQKFRAIRAKSRNPMDTCFWCRYSFQDGDMMGLAAFEKGPNKVLCQGCADELLASAGSAIAKTEESDDN